MGFPPKGQPVTTSLPKVGQLSDIVGMTGLLECVYEVQLPSALARWSWICAPGRQYSAPTASAGPWHMQSTPCSPQKCGEALLTVADARSDENMLLDKADEAALVMRPRSWL